MSINSSVTAQSTLPRGFGSHSDRKTFSPPQIASGSFGSVHQGWNGGREVAVKLLHIPESSSDKEKRAALHAFKQEVSVWHALHHPNIVEVRPVNLDRSHYSRRL